MDPVKNIRFKPNQRHANHSVEVCVPVRSPELMGAMSLAIATDSK
jgi:hypothetical protein